MLHYARRAAACCLLMLRAAIDAITLAMLIRVYADMMPISSPLRHARFYAVSPLISIAAPARQQRVR